MSKKETRTQIPRDVVCTCKICNHGIARDCIKLNCDCCTTDDHSMILDGMVGFGSIPKK